MKKIKVFFFSLFSLLFCILRCLFFYNFYNYISFFSRLNEEQNTKQKCYSYLRASRDIYTIQIIINVRKPTFELNEWNENEWIRMICLLSVKWIFIVRNLKVFLVLRFKSSHPLHNELQLNRFCMTWICMNQFLHLFLLRDGGGGVRATKSKPKMNLFCWRKNEREQWLWISFHFSIYLFYYLQPESKWDAEFWVRRHIFD